MTRSVPGLSYGKWKDPASVSVAFRGLITHIILYIHTYIHNNYMCQEEGRHLTFGHRCYEELKKKKISYKKGLAFALK